jgi:hypothetical protein
MMFRIAIISGLALASTIVASAGQIQVGAGANGVNGLTTAYVGSGNCGGNCFDTNNFDEVLFENLNDAASPGTNYSINSATQNSITDTNANAQANGNGPGGVKFALINDGTYGSPCSIETNQCGFNSSNYWSIAGSPNNQTLTIPVGQYGVTQVWSMLNTDFAGAANGTPADRSVTMFLDFGTSGGTVEDTVRVNFTNTGNNSTGTGQIESAILCTSVVPCNGIANPNGGPLQTTNPTTLTANGVSVGEYTDNMFSIKYNGTGNLLVLNDQGLNLGTINFGAFGTNLNTYLVDVRVVEEGNSSYTSEYTALSALTVVTAAPEPSTVFMFLAGLGAIGFVGFRRRKV